MPVTGIVVDDRQFARALVDQAVHQVRRISSIAKAADQYRGPIGYIGERGWNVRDNFVDHVVMGEMPRGLQSTVQAFG